MGLVIRKARATAVSISSLKTTVSFINNNKLLSIIIYNSFSKLLQSHRLGKISPKISAIRAASSTWWPVTSPCRTTKWWRTDSRPRFWICRQNQAEMRKTTPSSWATPRGRPPAACRASHLARLRISTSNKRCSRQWSWHPSVSSLPRIIFSRGSNKLEVRLRSSRIWLSKIRISKHLHSRSRNRTARCDTTWIKQLRKKTR